MKLFRCLKFISGMTRKQFFQTGSKVLRNTQAANFLDIPILHKVRFREIRQSVILNNNGTTLEYIAILSVSAHLICCVAECSETQASREVRKTFLDAPGRNPYVSINSVLVQDRVHYTIGQESTAIARAQSASSLRLEKRADVPRDSGDENRCSRRRRNSNSVGRGLTSGKA